MFFVATDSHRAAFPLVLLLCLATRVASSAAESPPARTWTDAASGRTIEAEFLGLSDGKIRLKTKDGKVWELLPDRLIQADRDFVQHALAAKDVSSSSPVARNPPRLKVFTDKRSRQSITGYVVRYEESGGHTRILVRTEGDQEVWLFGGQCEITDASQPASDSVSAGSLTSPSGRSEVEINLPGGQEAASAASPTAKEVVVTGVGVDPEKALQDAFGRAIEQTVGVLVDAETVVKNDQLIRDEVLTYSRGYMEKYEVVRRREEGGLHHATIRATVSRDKLVQKLKAMKVAVQDVAGEIAGRQFEFDAKNEEQAAEMLKKALAGFDMTKLTKVEIIGEPNISRDGANANVRLKVKLSADLARWREFSRDARLVLSKAATKRSAIVWQGSFSASSALTNQLAGEGKLVALLVNASISGDRMDWDIFRVPDPLSHAIRAIKKELPEVRLVCALLGDADREIVRVATLRSGEGSRSGGRGQSTGLGEVLTDEKYLYGTPSDTFWCLGPVWWYGETGYGSVRYTAVTLSVSQEDLKAVRKATAFLEQDE